MSRDYIHFTETELCSNAVDKLSKDILNLIKKDQKELIALPRGYGKSGMFHGAYSKAMFYLMKGC